MNNNKNTIIFGNLDINGLDIEKYIPKEYYDITTVFDTNFDNLRTAIETNNAKYVIVNAHNLNEKEIIKIIKDMMDFDPKLCSYKHAKFDLYILTNKKVDTDKILDSTSWDSCVLFPVETEKQIIKFGKSILDYNDEAPTSKATAIKDVLIWIIIILGILITPGVLYIIATKGFSFIFDACNNLF